jgi:uncharacterized protein
VSDEVLEVPTRRGTARVTVSSEKCQAQNGPARVSGKGLPLSRHLLVLGHGAGDGIGAPDLLLAREAALELGMGVALVEQPYRVLGRRNAPPAPHLDEAWVAVCAALRERAPAGTRLVTGGRSSGARVACRTAQATGAAGVLCLAFPLQAKASRQPELDGAGVPVLVVQGERDRFGVPEPDPALGRVVVVVRGDHGLKADGPLVRAAVLDWLGRLAA